ncbi:PE-PGRS family protein [Streptomyces sp. NPDC005393]|uniref:PE-PGRS family protein n=1 Tax=Streptomyces sp. NPDC005393 TaxID=3157041 RepID=UPI0033B9210F
MRNVNPGDLEQLAKLIDGKGGVADKLREAFTRASSLDASGKLATLKPLSSWVTDTAPDLRKRAAIARLEDGDPEAGLKWAGFTAEDIKKYKGEGLTPDALLLANSVAANDSPQADVFQRKSNESLSDWLDRMKAHAIAKIPGLQPHEQTIQTMIGLYGDWTSVNGTSATVTIQGTVLTKVLLGNSLKNGALRTWKTRLGVALRGSRSGLIQKAGNGLIKWTPKLRSLGAPGSWFPSKLSQWAQGRVPGTSGVVGDWTGTGFNAARRLPFMNSPVWRGLTANKVINFVVGSDTLAARYGGLTHSGQAVARAGNANLFKVAGNIYTRGRAVGWSRGAALTKGLAGAGKVSGALRGLGVAGGVASTAFSAANVISQGNPVDAFKRNGAGYVADVAEVGFNASMTAAMVAPNPFTIGAAVVFGGVYVGAKVVEHWDDVKAGTKKAVEWTGDAAKKVGSGIASGAKAVAKAANPMNWF